MSKLENKNEAHDRIVFRVLNENKYTPDYKTWCFEDGDV